MIKLNSTKVLNLILAFSISVLILLMLGTWQLERLIWKNALLTQISKQFSLPTIKFNYSVINNLPEYINRKIKIKGNFSYDNNLTIYSKVYKGYVGRHLIVPMETKFGWVLVNRGFIPEKNFKDYLQKGYSNQVLIEGIIHLPGSKSYFTPKNNLTTGEWYYLNIEEIKKYTDLPLLKFVIFEAKNKNLKEFPIAGQYIHKNIPNDHLQYAFTWFSLAIVLFIILRIFWSKNIYQ